MSQNTRNWNFETGTRYNFAYTFATIVDGRAISVRGHDVTDALRHYNETLPWEDHD